MSEFSDYYENKIIDHMLRAQAFTPPATLYVALFTGSAASALEANNPTTEVSGGGYARKAVTLSAGSSGATANTNEVDFGTASAAWGEVTHAAIVDHETNTTWGTNVNVLMFTPLTANKTVASGDIVKIEVGSLTVAVT